MKLFCCFTPAHEILFRNYFLPSLPSVFSLQVERIEVAGPGDYLSPEFLQCINQKIQLVLESLAINQGEVIVWSDIDIQFFDLSEKDLLAHLGDHDIAFQRESKIGPAVNTGFFVCRSNHRVSAFFQEVEEGLRLNPSANEQFVVNELLRADSDDLSYTYLPFTYYARTQGWPPPMNLVLYHANFTVGAEGIAQKLQQFRELDFLRRFPPYRIGSYLCQICSQANQTFTETEIGTSIPMNHTGARDLGRVLPSTSFSRSVRANPGLLISGLFLFAIIVYFFGFVEFS